MNTIEILQMEQNNPDRIILHKEGTFWKAYERSAFLFYHHVRPFKLKRKYIKVVSADVVSLGFPLSSLQQTLTDCQTESPEEGLMVIHTTHTVDDAAFTAWKQGIPLQQPPGSNAHLANGTNGGCPLPETVPDSRTLTKQILDFQLESKTPMECMLFLATLKQTLYGIQ